MRHAIPVLFGLLDLFCIDVEVWEYVSVGVVGSAVSYLIWEFSLEFSKSDTPRIKNNKRV